MDLATLEIHVNSNDLITAKSNLDALSASAANVDQKFSGSSTNMAASVRKQAEAAQSAGAAVRAATDATVGLGDANLAAAEAATHHSITLGRVERSMESAIVRATGFNEQLGLLAAAFGHLEVGAVEMIAILGGVFAVVKGYELLTEDATKAQQAQDKLTDALHKWRLEQDNGPAGKLVDEINAATKAIDALKKSLASTDQSGNAPFIVQLKAQLAGLFAGLSGDPTAIGAATANYIKKWYADQVKGIQEGGKDVAAATVEANRLVVEAMKSAFNEQQAAFLAFLPNSKTTIGADAIIDGLNKEFEAMQKVAAQNAKDFVASQDAARLEGLQGVALAELTAYLKAEAAQLEANATLNGIALTDRLAHIDADKDAALARAKVAEAIALETERIQLNDDLSKRATATGNANAKAASEQAKAFVDAANAQQKYNDAIKSTLEHGFEEIFKNGLQSAEKFFTDVLSLFDKLMKDMTAAGKASGFGFGALQVGQSAVAGGLAGFSIGQQSGAAAGVFGGAGAGALFGAETGNPFAAIIGGLAGAVGGLLGAANAHKEAAAALKAAADQLQTNTSAYIASATSSPLATQIAANAAKADALRQQINDAYAKGAITQGQLGAQSVGVTQAQYTIDQTLIKNFFDSIAAQLSALHGPAGVFANQLAAAATAYDQNTKDAIAAGASQAQLDDVTKLYDETVKQLTADYAQAQKALQQNLDARQKAAEGDANAAALLQKQAADQQEYYDAQKNGYTDAQLAQLAYIQSLEEVALAAAQAAAKLSASATDIENAVSGGFITGASGLAGEAALFGFTGLSDADIRAKYTDPTQGALTDAQRTLNAQITQYLNDEAKWGPALATAAGALAGTGPAGASGSVNLQKQAIASAAAGLTQATGNRMADYLASIYVVEKEIRDDIRGTSGFTINRTAVPTFSSTSSQRPSPQQSTSTNGAAVTNISVVVKVVAADGENLDALATRVAAKVDKVLGDEYANRQQRIGSPSRTGL